MGTMIGKDRQKKASATPDSQDELPQNTLAGWLILLMILFVALISTTAAIIEWSAYWAYRQEGVVSKARITDRSITSVDEADRHYLHYEFTVDDRTFRGRSMVDQADYYAVEIGAWRDVYYDAGYPSNSNLRTRAEISESVIPPTAIALFFDLAILTMVGSYLHRKRAESR